MTNPSYYELNPVCINECKDLKEVRQSNYTASKSSRLTNEKLIELDVRAAYSATRSIMSISSLLSTYIDSEVITTKEASDIIEELDRLPIESVLDRTTRIKIELSERQISVGLNRETSIPKQDTSRQISNSTLPSFYDQYLIEQAELVHKAETIDKIMKANRLFFEQCVTCLGPIAGGNGNIVCPSRITDQ